MRYFFKVMKAEMIKQQKNYLHNKTIYISLFLWPVLTFISAYYSYKPFQVDKIADAVRYINEDNLIVFMLVGYMSLLFFRTLVQSAWMFSSERIYGTLELVYLTPANRLAFIMGNAVSSLFTSVWMFVVFGVSVLVLKGRYFNIDPYSAVAGIVLMVVLSVLWGMLLNSLFLFSRDTGFLFTLLEEPMEIFSGIKIPPGVFPIWAKIISMIFPLTYSAEALRRALLNGDSLYELRGFIIVSLIMGFIMLSITLICLKAGESHAKKTGSMSLF
jgi:ABC-2 type transport system permease protein